MNPGTALNLGGAQLVVCTHAHACDDAKRIFRSAEVVCVQNREPVWGLSPSDVPSPDKPGVLAMCTFCMFLLAFVQGLGQSPKNWSKGSKLLVVKVHMGGLSSLRVPLFGGFKGSPKRKPTILRVPLTLLDVRGAKNEKR